MVDGIEQKGGAPRRKEREQRWLTSRLRRMSNQLEDISVPPESGYAKLMGSYGDNRTMSEDLRRMYGPALGYIRLLPGPSDETKDLIQEEFVGGNKDVIEKVGLEMAARLEKERPRGNLELRSYCMGVALNIDLELISQSARSTKALKQRIREVRNDPWEVFLANYRSR